MPATRPKGRKVVLKTLGSRFRFGNGWSSWDRARRFRVKETPPSGRLPDAVPLDRLLLLASSSDSLTATPLALQLAAERFELRRRPGQVTLPVWFDRPHLWAENPVSC